MLEFNKSGPFYLIPFYLCPDCCKRDDLPSSILSTSVTPVRERGRGEREQEGGDRGEKKGVA
jgi:hypothetical protein